MKVKPIVLFFALFIGWLMISWSLLDWFFLNLTLHFDALHAVLLICIAAVWLKSINIKNFNFYTSSKAAVVLMCASLLALILLKIFSPIRLFGFVFTMLFLYGLLGFLQSPRSWVKGLIPFGLLLMTLPFGRHLDVFIGYPLRMLSVDACYAVLKPFVPKLNTNASLLILENRASHIDMDCSGLKGLWIGLICLFTIGWVEKQAKLSKWFAVVFFMVTWLIMGNILRIMLLTLIHIVWVKPELDVLVHHAASVFFLISCVGGMYFILRQKGAYVGSIYPEKLPTASEKFTTISSVILAISLLILMQLPAFGETQPSNINTLEIAFAEANWQKMKLSENEQNVYKREGVEALKYQKDQLQLILILNGDWRSQHKPELCYELSGYKISAMQAGLIQDSLHYKALRFHEQKSEALFWFQNGANTTDDFAEKVWNQLWSADEKWTLVSLLNTDGAPPKSELLHIYKILLNYNSDV